MTTVLGYAPAKEHSLEGHPENARRMAAIMNLLERQEIFDQLALLEVEAATTEQLRRVHRATMIDEVEQASRLGGGYLDPDTYCTSASFDQARLAAGTVCKATDLIMQGEADNGIALVRPPGHHAERGRVGGFCLMNNVAVAARQAQAVHGAKRVVIVDYDVHHGNGTQDIFYEDPSVLYVSLHLYAPFFYPGTGAAEEIGRGEGRGATLNVPFPTRAGDDAYDLVFSDLLEPAISAFKPDMVFVSAGFDAHWQDPLAAAAMSLSGYDRMTRRLIDAAAASCAGRILFVLEGGYHFQALAHGVSNVVHALVGQGTFSDPLGPAPYASPDITNLLAQLQRLHLPS